MYNQAGVDALDAVRAVVASFGAPIAFRKFYGTLNAMEMHVEETPYKQPLDSLRRKDPLRGAETTGISVRLESYSASHFEGSAYSVEALQHLGKALEATARLYQVDQQQHIQLARALATFLRTVEKP